MNVREIAKLANVSTATVSRILNGNPMVKKELRDRVMRIVEESNYVPSGIARSMNHGRTSILGLVLPDITNPFFPGIARGVEDAANASGYKVILCNTDNQAETEESYLRMLREQRVDGLILVSSALSPNEGISKWTADIPVVWLDRVSESTQGMSVMTDHHKGATLAFQHLLELSHREIAVIADPTSSSTVSRSQIFLTLMEQAGLAMSHQRIVPGDYGYESGHRAMQRILQDGDVTAVFCANDLMAIGAIDAVFAAGRSVPDDISIIGYDNVPFANWSRPSLTTVSQPTYALGMTAVELLMNHLQGSAAPSHQSLEPSLVIRKSTSRVRT